MKTILVATDFSPAANNAANYAAEMATAVNGNLLVFHTYQIPLTYLEVPVVIGEADIRKNAEQNMLALLESLKMKTGNRLSIETEIKMGTFFHELKETCENIAPYAVVLGSQGTTATEHFLFGTHAVYAMKHLAWPVITVPFGAKFSAVKKIGLACDFSKVVNTTPVEEITLLVRDFNAALLVLNTGRKTDFEPDIVFESALLQEMIGNLNPSYHFITNDKTDEAIIEFAEKNHIDLLIVLPKRYSLLDKLVHRSHTKQLVLHSHVPVVALHQETL